MKADPHPGGLSTGKRILILTGEPSGDVHGGRLATALQQADPQVQLLGIGGPNMAAANVHLIYDIEHLSVMGLVEILGQFRQIRHAFRIFQKTMKRVRPHLVILIDYPGFNLKAAAWTKAHTQAKVMYYIPPKVWAWNKRRLKAIKATVDHTALIFPFEPSLYRKHRIPATFVGNPLLDQYPTQPLDTPEKTSTQNLTIGLLPGSRKTEIEKLLGVLLETGLKLQRQLPGIKCLVSCAQSITGKNRQRFDELVAEKNNSGLFEVVTGHPQAIFNRSDLVLAASGTVTLEAALCAVPTILIYKMAPVTYGIARLLVKLEHVGLANLVAGRTVMPELLQEDAEPHRIFAVAMEMLEDLPRYRRGLDLVRARLGSPGASKRAAGIALDLAGRTSHKGI